jgi:hypothetical protein
MRCVFGCFSGILAVLLIALIGRVLFDVSLPALLSQVALPGFGVWFRGLVI